MRVLMNLGRNAAEALPGTGGLISIMAWQTADDTVIDLADTGRGIPKVQAHLFEAFSGSARPGGTGLGLAIARESCARTAATSCSPTPATRVRRSG
jgi:signal transduction histidine kinase